MVASVSDTGGRRLSFIICFSIYIVANIGLALQTNYAALLVLRCVQAAGSSGTIALSIAVVADIATSAERGKYMGYATAGILIGPALGPTLGGTLI
jgi:MFS family permease